MDRPIVTAVEKKRPSVDVGALVRLLLKTGGFRPSPVSKSF
jgi:hypothetical protein